MTWLQRKLKQLIINVQSARSQLVPTSVVEATRTQDEVLVIAKQFASEKGWPWLEPSAANYERGEWHVHSNFPNLGTNIWVRIDDATGGVLGAGYIPR